MKVAYLHGLEANHKGEKPDWLSSRFDESWTPKMDYRDPKLYKKTFNELKKRNPDYLIGSSMGGWFAFLLGSQLGIPTILFNPALQNRSFEPNVNESTPISVTHNIFFGKSDDVVSPKETQESLKDYKNQKIKENWYDGGHRVPFKVFKDAVIQVTGIRESSTLPMYNDFMKSL